MQTFEVQLNYKYNQKIFNYLHFQKKTSKKICKSAIAPFHQTSTQNVNNYFKNH
jgi:hypothetical protein